MHSIVVPLFNELALVDTLFARLVSVIDMVDEKWEIILVDDGSSDGTSDKILRICRQDARFKTLKFSRNFGHQSAICAGLEWASGQTVTIIDGDLQDPPEIILDFLKKWHEGFKVVYGVRRHRPGETRFKVWTAAAFYWLMNRISSSNIVADSGDFRLMDREVVDTLLAMPERVRFLRGLSAWVGFSQCAVYYDRHARHEGETHYSVKRMIRLAVDAITSFSDLPLNLAGVLSLFLFMLGSITLARTVIGPPVESAQFNALLITGVCLLIGSCQLLCLRILGAYVSRISQEVKMRPLYIVEKSVGFSRHSNSEKLRKRA